MKPSKPIKTKKKKSGNAYNRPYNRYNLYFILERENLILAKGGTPKTSTLLPGDPGFDGLDLPPLPPRFDHLKMPDGWCIPGHQKKRPHRKTHGVATFRELAQCIAKSWKTIDGATLAYCAAVEKILKKRHEELKKANPGWSKPKPKSHQIKQSKEATTKQRPDLAKQHNNNEEAFPDGTTTRVRQAASSATTADLLDQAQACFLQAQARKPAMPEFNVCGDNGLSNNGADVPPSYNNAMMMMMMSYNHHSNNQSRPSQAQLTSMATPRQAYDARHNGSASQANAFEMFGGDANGNSQNRNTESIFQMFGDGINNAATATNFNGMNNHGNDNATASRMADKIEALAASIRASQESSMNNSVNNRSIQNSMQGSLNSSDQSQSNPLSMAPNHPLFNSNAMLLNNQDHLFANMLNAQDVHNNNNNALLRSQDIINNLHHRDSIPNGMSNNQSSSIANHHAQHQHPIPCSEVQIDPMLDGYHSPDTNDDNANVTSNNGKSSLRGGDIFDVPEGAGEEDDAASLFAPNDDPSGLELVDIDDATLANISDDDIRSMWYEDF